MLFSAQKLLPSLLILPVALVTALTVLVQAQKTVTTGKTTFLRSTPAQSRTFPLGR
jgi:uncharacterized membrane-anchored protein